MSPTPGKLELVPNSTEPMFFWQGLAYMGADIDCCLAAPKVTGDTRPRATWAVPGEVAGDRRRAGHGQRHVYARGRDAAGRTSPICGRDAGTAEPGDRVDDGPADPARRRHARALERDRLGRRRHAVGMFLGDVTLRGQKAARRSWGYQTAAVLTSWTRREDRKDVDAAGAGCSAPIRFSCGSRR